MSAVSSAPPSSELRGVFPNTRWSEVLAARRDSPESSAALESICRAYWFPLYAFARRCGHSPPDAQDLTQEFFRQLLEKRWLDRADRAKGRLRTFLVVAFKNLMSKEWRRALTQRRGGNSARIEFDTALAESRFAADPTTMTPDEAFDRQWAMTLLELTVFRLSGEFADAGKPGEFDLLKDCLLAERGAIDYADVAKRLGINEGAARVVVHRLRKRFREIYSEEIARTLDKGEDINAELRHLAAALARR